MNQKKIFDHLADVYLDSPSNSKHASKIPETGNKEDPADTETIEERPKNNVYKKLFLISAAAAAILLIAFIVGRNHRLVFESAIVLAPETVKVEFAFEPAQKSIYSIRIAKQDISAYKTLKFQAKTADPKDIINLRIELSNTLNERSEVYMSALPGKWKEYTIDLADFKKISDWKSINTLAFILEEWNSVNDKGTIYFDNVRLAK